MSDIQSKQQIKAHWERLIGQNLEPSEIWYNYPIRPGFYLQNGAVALPKGVSFTVHSAGARHIDLLLFRRGAANPFAIIPYPAKYKVGDVYSMIVFDLDITDLEYAFQVDGEYSPEDGLYFDRKQAVVDPYVRKLIIGDKSKPYPYRGAVTVDTFDWGDSVAPGLRQDEMIIYELHVKGFTAHNSSAVDKPGTFAGLKEKIPYLKHLGINVVELMPIFAFDKTQDEREFEGQVLQDYWGYNPATFYAYHTPYASEDQAHIEGQELKELVKELHDNGIEVILDVVFNHTIEGDHRGPYINFRGFDNNIYYLLTPDGQYYNFSGCGNTLNANHPVVRQMILECLRYWVSSYHIDGFRFDLASILGRNEDGSPMSDPPLLKSLAYDPILKKVELIAEAWDAGGLYQVGSFPSWSRWGEWNGQYRDDMRRFLKGDEGLAHTAVARICGSRDLYPPEKRGSYASVNFITCHDGFTLRDLYSYNEKHNEANGWANTDGESNNNSWNCGIEGETKNPGILALRQKMMLNACVVLLSSIGIPMILAGDEFGNTQFGNNNPYCQDNEISWLDWSLLDKNHQYAQFWRQMIQFRKHHPILRGSSKASDAGFPKTSYHGMKAWYLEEEANTRYVGVMFAGKDEFGHNDEVIYLAINTDWKKKTIHLPSMPHKENWHQIINTAEVWGKNFIEDFLDAPVLENYLVIEPRSVSLLLAKPQASWQDAAEQKELIRLNFMKRQKGRSKLYRYHLRGEIKSGTYTPWVENDDAEERVSREEWKKYLPKKNKQ